MIIVEFIRIYVAEINEKILAVILEDLKKTTKQVIILR